MILKNYKVADGPGADVGVARHGTVEALLLLAVRRVGHGLGLAAHGLQTLRRGDRGHVQHEVHTGHALATFRLLFAASAGGIAGVAGLQVFRRHLMDQHDPQECDRDRVPGTWYSPHLVSTHDTLQYCVLSPGDRKYWLS